MRDSKKIEIDIGNVVKPKMLWSGVLFGIAATGVVGLSLHNRLTKKVER